MFRGILDCKYLIVLECNRGSNKCVQNEITTLQKRMRQAKMCQSNTCVDGNRLIWEVRKTPKSHDPRENERVNEKTCCKMLVFNAQLEFLGGLNSISEENDLSSKFEDSV